MKSNRGESILRLLSTLTVFFFFQSGCAQILEPAKWSSVNPEAQVKLGDKTDLTFNVDLDDTWQLYSNIQDYDIGPLPAFFEFEPNGAYELVGVVEAIGSKTKHEAVFDVDVNYFEGMAEFRQKVKILKPNPAIRGTVNYQVCTTVDGKCINQEEGFEFRIKTKE